MHRAPAEEPRPLYGRYAEMRSACHERLAIDRASIGVFVSNRSDRFFRCLEGSSTRLASLREQVDGVQRPESSFRNCVKDSSWKKLTLFMRDGGRSNNL